MLYYFTGYEKQWINSENAPSEEKPELAMQILLDSINLVATPK